VSNVIRSNTAIQPQQQALLCVTNPTPIPTQLPLIQTISTQPVAHQLLSLPQQGNIILQQSNPIQMVQAPAANTAGQYIQISSATPQIIQGVPASASIGVLQSNAPELVEFL
jgi:hypothetical protein